MASRSLLCGLLSAAFLIPATVFAQADAASAPAPVDQALRARVTEFFQDFVDHKFRAAINLVAEDTQDYYFSSPKAEITKFKINGTKYTGDFTKATVSVTTTQILHLRAEGFAQDTEVPETMETTWKIEDGKWVFYDKPKCSGWVTPMGPSSDLCSAAASASADKKKIDDGTMAAEAQRILDASGKATGITPSELTFRLDKPSSGTVTFHNGVAGSVAVGVEAPSEVPGLTFDKTPMNVNPGKDATIEFHYAPPDGASFQNVTLHVVLAPFGTAYPLQIHLGTPDKN